MKHLIKISSMALIASATLAGCAGSKYPQAPTDITVVDDYFGTQVADPYRPLENDTAAATLQWVEAERAQTEDYLSKIPFRGALRQRISDFNDYVKQGTPWKGEDG